GSRALGDALDGNARRFKRGTRSIGNPDFDARHLANRRGVRSLRGGGEDHEEHRGGRHGLTPPEAIDVMGCRLARCANEVPDEAPPSVTSARWEDSSRSEQSYEVRAASRQD